MAGGIRSLDSFMENYSEPAWLDEKPQSFASALKEWQQIQGNYYKNDKAKMELEDKEEAREKNKEREKKMLELGLTLDADDIQGSLRKVIDFSRGEGDINSAMSGIGRLYQLKENDKKRADADARKALGKSKEEQAKLDKIAEDKEANKYLQAGIANGGFSQQGIQEAAKLAIQNGDLKSARAIGAFGKSFFGTGKTSSGGDNFVDNLMNNATNPSQANNSPQIKYTSKQDKKNRLKLENGKSYYINGKLMTVVNGQLLQVGE